MYIFFESFTSVKEEFQVDLEKKLLFIIVDGIPTALGKKLKFTGILKQVTNVFLI